MRAGRETKEEIGEKSEDDSAVVPSVGKTLHCSVGVGEYTVWWCYSGTVWET